MERRRKVRKRKQKAGGVSLSKLAGCTGKAAGGCGSGACGRGRWERWDEVTGRIGGGGGDVGDQNVKRDRGGVVYIVCVVRERWEQSRNDRVGME